MVLRLWKKKLPKREDKMMKRVFKTEEGVFDSQTRFTLYSFMNKGVISGLDYPISTGKEADVYRARAGPNFEGKGEFVAVKIYRIDTSDFMRMMDYLQGDPRFAKVKHSKRETVYAWARKEYRNLLICREAKVPVPEPYASNKNVLLMEFIGENGVPDSTLKDLGSDTPEKDCETLLSYVKKLYKNRFVHADLSEFNVLMHGYPDIVPYLIDVGQGVVLDHPKSQEFLERDIERILHYFKKYGVKKDFDATLKWVKAKE
ncbi:RIO-type serine/threonine-protein kinase Rio1 [uncultured archaeon]|nr:RIO-type serine/threonine-protein kinase Rio1 [uncultured archaeon]